MADRKEIYSICIKNVPSWNKNVTSPDQLIIDRLSGLSNACYKVQLTEEAFKKIEGNV